MINRFYHPVIHFWTLWFSEAMVYYLRKNARQIGKNESIADIGCGMEYHCFKMLKYKPLIVTGVDISSETIDFLRSFTDEINFEILDISNVNASR